MKKLEPVKSRPRSISQNAHAAPARSGVATLFGNARYAGPKSM